MMKSLSDSEANAEFRRRRFRASIRCMVLINDLSSRKTEGREILPNFDQVRDVETLKLGSRSRSLEIAAQKETAYEIPVQKIQSSKLPLLVRNRQISDAEMDMFKQRQISKFLYFSQATKLMQFEFLTPTLLELLGSKNYWLNITDPNEQDLEILLNTYELFDSTFNHIRNRSTEEIIEIYQHYTFLSIRRCVNEKIELVRTNFNIIYVKNMLITLQYSELESSVAMETIEIFNILSTNSQNIATPDWVLLYCFLELKHHASHMLKLIEPELNNIKFASKSFESQEILNMIRKLEMELNSICEFIKPKMMILRSIKHQCSERVDKTVMRLLGNILEDLGELNDELNQYNHILERSLDTYLALVSFQQSRNANELNKVMTRISELALISIPVQAVGNIFKMHVSVPFQSNLYTSGSYFYAIVGCCMVFTILLYIFRKYILRS